MLFDTNVVLDLLLDREPFSTDAAHLFTQVENGRLHGYLCATTLTTIHYLVTKGLGATHATAHVKALLSLFEVAPVTRVVLESAVTAGFRDYEDAVVYEAARDVGVEVIVTRNLRDFSEAELTVLAPPTLLKML